MSRTHDHGRLASPTAGSTRAVRRDRRRGERTTDDEDDAFAAARFS
jgi:hypothetical protein